jgi:hypothetical protein
MLVCEKGIQERVTRAMQKHGLVRSDFTLVPAGAEVQQTPW